MMITMLFKNFYQTSLRSKNFKQKLRHQVEEAEAIQKLPPSHHPWF